MKTKKYLIPFVAFFPGGSAIQVQPSQPQKPDETNIDLYPKNPNGSGSDPFGVLRKDAQGLTPIYRAARDGRFDQVLRMIIEDV